MFFYMQKASKFGFAWNGDLLVAAFVVPAPIKKQLVCLTDEIRAT